MAVLVLLLGACQQSEDNGERANATTPKWVAPTADETANTSYRGIYDTPVRLHDGVFEGDPFVEGGASRPTVTLVTDVLRTADIDDDGEVEAAVILAETSGGSGSNLYLAVVARRVQGVVNLGTAPIGDRVQIRSFRLTGNGIELDVIQAGPDDAMCCPSQKATRIWTLGPYGLREGPPELTGTFFLDDVAGIEWILKEMEKPVADSVTVTLTIGADRVGGACGCNRYFAEIKQTSAGEVVIGDIGSTMMMCPDNIMDIERAYLSALGGVTGYSFLVERLVLTSRQGDQLTRLVFIPKESPSP